MPDTYPITLRPAGRRVCVVGGGPVSARRVAALQAAGAEVRVIAPQLCEDLAELLALGRIDHVARDYEPGDLDGAWLVHAATGSLQVDAQVGSDAEARQVWCTLAGDASSATAWTPAVARVDDVTIAVSAGGDPRRAGRLRSAVATVLQSGDLPLRRQRSGPGRVDLVGAGPGDEGLLTTRGRRLLGQADVVVHDTLVPRSLLDGLDDDVEVVDVGKTAGHHPVPQHEINALLVEHAGRGRRVVRFKGGDPFVLGRGGEEVLACRAAGVEVHVTPGVSSAVAVPAALGVPVTHRGASRSFTVVSAHEDLQPDALPKAGTLVLMMGISGLAETAERIVSAGWDAATPAAVLEDGFGARHRRVLGTLGTIAERAEAAGVRPPGIVVVGEVVALAEQLLPDQPSSHPLSRTRPDPVVLVAHGSRDPRSRQVNEDLAAAMRLRLPGAEVVVSQLDHAGPRPDEAVDALAALGHRRVRIQPLLFTPAYHVSVDLPAALSGCAAVRAGVEPLVQDVLGGDDLLLDALDRRLGELGADAAGATALVLASAGSSSPDARAGLVALAARWGLRHGVATLSTYASAADPRVGDGVASLVGAGHHVVVGSLFLGPGYLPDRARAHALQAGALAVTAPLGAAPELVDLLSERYRNGPAGLTTARGVREETDPGGLQHERSVETLAP